MRGLTLTAAPGECVVLAGPNGSGKSTALSVLAGVLRPGSGTVRVDGPVGYAPQGTGLFEDMTVEDNLAFFARLAGCKVPGALPFGVERYGRRRVSRLSVGMKKQVSIACALLGDPMAVLLDEPCAALDMEYREELAALIGGLKERGRAVVYVGHEPMEFASFYDKLVFFGGEWACYSRTELSGEPAEDSRLCDNFGKLFQGVKRKGADR